MSTHSKGTERKATFNSAEDAQAAEGAAGDTVAAAAASTGASASLYAIYCSRKTEVTDYDEDGMYEVDLFVDNGNPRAMQWAENEIDTAAEQADGVWYHSNSRDGPQPQPAKSGKGNTSSSVNSSGPLVAFKSVEAAYAKAAELFEQMLQQLPKYCKAESGSTASSGAVCKVQGGTQMWEAEQQLTVSLWEGVNSVAVSEVVVAVVPVQVVE